MWMQSDTVVILFWSLVLLVLIGWLFYLVLSSMDEWWRNNS